MFLADQRVTHAPLPSCVTLVRPFFLIFLSISRHPIAAKHCSLIVLKVFDVFRPPDTPSDHKKRITVRCSSLVQTESGAAMVNVTVGAKELTEQLQICTVVIRRKPRLAMHAKTTVLPTETRMQLHCGLLLAHPPIILVTLILVSSSVSWHKT